MLLVVALGRLTSAEGAVLELYQQELDPVRRGFLAASAAQRKDPKYFSKAYGEEFLLSLDWEGAGSARDLGSLLPRLGVEPIRSPLRDLLLGDFSSTRNAFLARGLAYALSAVVRSDPEVRKLLLVRAMKDDFPDVSSDLASIIADGASGGRPDSELMSDAMQLLESGPTEAVRDAVALRLARSKDGAVSARLTGLLTNPETPCSTRLRILSGIEATAPSFEHLAGQAIVNIAERSTDPLVRRRAVAALSGIRGWSEQGQAVLHGRLLADPDPDIRIEAIRSVERLRLEGSYEAVRRLEREDLSPTVRRVASELGGAYRKSSGRESDP